ncbi:hypothetical protein [Paenibacillus odorifer]|uniref:hypothetical protein n=1 Tax=Paenibacillus odorifer TaxID=189426 RepID=UPI0020BF63C2|nr:hypothetical protein [Paenibacillus odorifer]
MSEAGKVSLPSMTPERIEEHAEFVEKFGKLPGHMALELLAALEESQQRIGKLELYVKSLEFNRDDTQKRVNEKLRERDTKLAEAQQTIAQQQGTLEFYALEDNNNWWIGGLDEVMPSEVMKDGGAKARAARGNKEGLEHHE